jgi:hypothetical protein
MPTHTYTVTVDSSFQGWTVGCILMPGETLRMQCSDSVEINGTPDYASPEGFYYLSIPNGPNHSFSPSNCETYVQASLDPATFMVGNTIPWSLNFVATVDGHASPLTSGNANAVCPQRDSTYTYAGIASTFLVTDPNAVIRVWLCFNDVLGSYSDNSGSFTVTLTRTSANSGGNTVPLGSLQKPQFVQESPYGSNAAATRMWNWVTNSDFTMIPSRRKPSPESQE